MVPSVVAQLLGPLGATEILLIVLVLVLLFGARKIPELARGLGRGITEFKQGIREDDREKDGKATSNRPVDKPTDKDS
ncbi:MAG: twin-arginine translocase TatA/TatE family subunit [Candidatus Eisenbacteria sp.]|nr:twin-arginine translocase TatA/TatE family subunit [Candidatus Eisenbacteria bacterium]